MTGLLFGFDDLAAGPDGISAGVAAGNADRPVWTYWMPLMCLLSRGAITPAPVTESAGRFVYPVEIRSESVEWCAEAPAGEPIAVIPPEVVRAVRDRRTLVLVSIMHEGRTLFDPEAPAGASVFDRVAELGERHGIAPEQLWFLSGNLASGDEVARWRRARGIAGEPFRFRACEPFSAFVGSCVRESLHERREPAVSTAFSRRGPHAIGWQRTKVGWVRRDFPAGGTDPEPRYRYACLNRMFRAHRWQVLTRLSQAGVLDRGLVSFPLPSQDDLATEGIDGSTARAREILRLLPLVIDRRFRFDDAAFFAENSAAVGLHPATVLRDCAMEIVTETYQRAGLFVSEKAFKALLGAGPAVIIGTEGVLSYLASIGVATWGEVVDESYDRIVSPDARLDAGMRAALALIDGSVEPNQPSVVAARRQNLRWLVDAPKPWDLLRRELQSALGSL